MLVNFSCLVFFLAKFENQAFCRLREIVFIDQKINFFVFFRKIPKIPKKKY